MLNFKTLCLIQAPIETVSGYGQHSRDIVKSLMKIYPDWEYSIIATRWGDTPMNGLHDEDIKSKINRTGELPRKPDIFIQISVPNEFNPVGEYNIGITAGIETNIASAEFLVGANKMQLLIVPSHHVKNVFETSQWQNKDTKEVIKLTTKCEVLFEGVDLNRFNNIKSNNSFDEYFKDIPESFCFISVGHWLNGVLGEDRKDIGMLVKTFLLTFANGNKDKPALILKTSQATFSPADETNMLSKIHAIKNQVIHENPNIENDLPNIYLLHGKLDDDQMNEFYNHSKVKAFVTFTKGEGFCRPLAEFATTGKPILASNWSGHIDFLITPGFIPLNGVVKQVHESAVWKGFIVPESNWFTVDYTAAGYKMRNVYDSYGKYLNNARQQRNHVIKNFSLDKMTEVFDEILKKYIKFKQPEFIQLNLPTLKKI